MTERKTLKEILLEPYEFSARKHDLGEDYAERQLNQMSRMQFFDALSEALEEWASQPPTA